MLLPFWKSAGANIEEADQFDGHIRRLLPNDTAEVCTFLLFAFWAFDKKPPKFILWTKPEKDQFDMSSSSTSTEPTLCIRSKTTNDGAALVQALSSLAPSKEEQEQKMRLLTEEARHKQNQENHDYLSWKRSECEKFLSDGITLPQDIIRTRCRIKWQNWQKNFFMITFDRWCQYLF
jgi:hypothetical protein